MTVCASTFGADYGISIESAPYEGTTVTIRTPRVPEDREGDYDKTIKTSAARGPGRAAGRLCHAARGQHNGLLQVALIAKNNRDSEFWDAVFTGAEPPPRNITCN